LGGDIRGRLAAFFAGIKIIVSTEQNINNSERWYQKIAKSITSLTATTIIAISQAVANDMRKRYHLPLKKCKLIIPNGIDLKKFIYQENIPDINNLSVGVVGRLHQQKGFDLLIKAWSIIKPKNAHLLIAGEGPEYKNLKNQIKQANLNQEINLLGDVKHINFFYENLNLLIIPSRWEGLGIVALEAGAKGIPILASNADGLKEVLNINNAWLFKADNLESLTKQLKLALNQITNKETIIKQKKLRKYIEDNFDIIKITKQYSDLYLKLWQKKYENSSSK
jgi:glycosyltransferase involved in cell wall biosynthesis